ncbi:MAG TPA: glycosyltransferase [Pseudonocardiaceae bacterium]|jgi:UDP:flavonoid glycosyltransferase YjiC (YdhE family)|nr:glycosyltransferase [Pseudonocardiaceae bacterium]
MFITVIALGLSGDVHPLTALARGLHEAGHTVRVATHRAWQTEVTQAGLEFADLPPGNVHQVVTDPAFLEVLEASRRPDRMFAAVRSATRSLGGRVQQTPTGRMRSLLNLARSYDEALVTDVWAASEGSDALVYGAPMAFHGYYAARARGIPSAAALIQPIDYQGGGGRRFVKEQVIWQIFRESIARWQRKEGQPVAPLRGPFPQWRQAGLPVVYGISPAVLPRPGHWAAQQQLAGYWFLDSAPDSSLPARVRDFLAAGPAPVYVTFGSMATRQPEQLTELVMSAIRETGDRAILATGWGGLSGTDSTDTVLCVDELPLDLVFPHVRAVVHHGGVMITAEGLRAGRPTVVIPSVLDQFDWGKRIAALGVGPDPVPRTQLTAAKLAAALAATRDPRLVGAAAELGARIRAERGVQHAVTALDQAFGA